jgi:nucleotide-binding universal stress UspA family protein
MILLAYDGSDNARAAIDHAARLMPGAEATVLTVWEPFFDALTRNGSMAGMGMSMAWGGTYADSEKMDAASQAAAQATATEGAERAVSAGLVARPLSKTRLGGNDYAILAAAEEVGADVIVMGTRGLGGVKSFLLGSVSHGVVQHADRAVLVVPSTTLAEHRRDNAHHDAVPA